MELELHLGLQAETGDKKHGLVACVRGKGEPSTTGGSLVVFVQTSGNVINSVTHYTASISGPDMDGWMGCALIYIFNATDCRKHLSLQEQETPIAADKQTLACFS